MPCTPLQPLGPIQGGPWSPKCPMARDLHLRAAAPGGHGHTPGAGQVVGHQGGPDLLVVTTLLGLWGFQSRVSPVVPGDLPCLSPL